MAGAAVCRDGRERVLCTYLEKVSLAMLFLLYVAAVCSALITTAAVVCGPKPAVSIMIRLWLFLGVAPIAWWIIEEVYDRKCVG